MGGCNALEKKKKYINLLCPMPGLLHIHLYMYLYYIQLININFLTI